MMAIELSRTECDNLDSAIGREWLVTNGLGGYASGTVAGINTRRYHGLLIAATRPPVDRMAMLVRLNEALTVEGEPFELTAAEFEDGTIVPEGYKLLDSFSIEQGVPTWNYNVRDYLLRRTVWMVPGRNVTVVRYKLVVGRGSVDLALRPLCAARDHHSVQHGNLDWHFTQEVSSSGVRLQASPESPPLWLYANGSSFAPGGDWYWHFLLREERNRGYDHVEDLYQPGTFHHTLRPGQSVTFIASTEDLDAAPLNPDIALAAVRALAENGKASDSADGNNGQLSELRQALRSGAHQFLVRRAMPEGSTQASLLAGYPWFTDWGRDSMICLPGLLLGTGRRDEAESLLRGFARYFDQGMIPNRFPDFGQVPEYNTADASLLFFEALRVVREDSGSDTLLQELFPLLADSIEWHMKGTRYGIGVDAADGLLRAGEVGADGRPTQLTWMDARAGDEVMTPRIGKPVEINAYWLSALDLMAHWAPLCGADPAPYAEAAARATASFAARFWCQSGGYLYDVVDGPDGDDASLRPNQLMALASRLNLIPSDQAKVALDRIAAELLTPYGPRTLSPHDARYRGMCEGDQPTRDRAYHNGTVWPWLLGSYVMARLRHGAEPEGMIDLVLPFHAHLREAGLSCVSEIFDGDAPHWPRGCIQQGWSVAELLRIIDLLRVPLPPAE